MIKFHTRSTMRTVVFAKLMLLLMLGAASAQSQRDVCHVYVLDVAKARRAAESFTETGNAAVDAKALSVGQTVFAEFSPVMGEEELTTKSYRFPGTRLMITASVYYTDESMASAEGSDSMTIGIAVSSRSLKNALTAENNTASEVTSNDKLDTIRAKKYLRVNGRLYLIGIECQRKQTTTPK
ncbi:MAG: hypothetical protein M3539_07325 [Acidobacteriota bacterium]|nr:hypothetical protein [Acidobacteriota bacterium]